MCIFKQKILIILERSHGKLSKEDILILSFDISNLECHKANVQDAVNHFGRVRTNIKYT